MDENLKDRLVSTLTEYAEIPSSSGAETELRNRLLTCFQRQNQSSGLEVDIHTFQNSLVVRGPVRSDRETIVLAGHLDTVPGGSWWQGNVIKENDSLIGLGVSDMKAGLCVMRHLLEPSILQTSRFNLIGVFYEHEEKPSKTAGLVPVLENFPWILDSDFAFVLEPTDNSFEVGCVGSLTGKVTVIGKAAHSGRPWNGVNALHKLAPILQKISDFGVREHQIEGISFFEVLSATMASAGTSANVIPAEAHVTINYRYPPTMSAEDAEGTLSYYLEPVCSVQYTSNLPSGRLPLKNKVFEMLRITLSRPERGKQGFTDVSTFARLGVDAINFGPGDPDQCHKERENIRIEALVENFQLYQKFLCYTGSR